MDIKELKYFKMAWKIPNSKNPRSYPNKESKRAKRYQISLSRSLIPPLTRLLRVS